MRFSAILSNYSGMTAYICRPFIPTTVFLVLTMLQISRPASLMVGWVNEQRNWRERGHADSVTDGLTDGWSFVDQMQSDYCVVPVSAQMTDPHSRSNSPLYDDSSYTASGHFRLITDCLWTPLMDSLTSISAFIINHRDRIIWSCQRQLDMVSRQCVGAVGVK